MEEHEADAILKLHMTAASDQDRIMLGLSAGNRSDALEDRALLQ